MAAGAAVTGGAGDAVRVLVVDDQRLIRDGIASVLGLQPGVEVAGTAADGGEALAAVDRLRPDVVLMDVRMPVLDGVAATREIRAGWPGVRVLMLTTFDDEGYVVDALRAGACGYLLKDLPAAELATAVRLAAAGIDQYDPAAIRRLAEVVGRVRPPGGPAPGLSPRETEVLRELATGASNREIARRLYLSEGTVKNHVSTILARLGLRDRTQAALYAREQGWA